jgi:hypothetical protein
MWNITQNQNTDSIHKYPCLMFLHARWYMKTKQKTTLNEAFDWMGISCVSKPMSQTFPGHSPHPIKQKKVPINMGLNVNRFRDIHCCVEIREMLWLTRNTLHFSRIARQYLNDHFPGKWIGRNVPVARARACVCVYIYIYKLSHYRPEQAHRVPGG